MYRPGSWSAIGAVVFLMTAAAAGEPRSAPSGPPEPTLAAALAAFDCARQRGQVRDSLLCVIDYGLPSTVKRLWVLDIERGAVLFHELVAHGRGTGEDEARNFSNESGSHRSSLGAFRTGEPYRGRHGMSLRLEGLEPGINDRAAERAIVVHGADYVSEDFARRFGRLGRSLGCPAVRTAVADSLIGTIRGGALLFVHAPDPGYQARSTYRTSPPGGR